MTEAVEDVHNILSFKDINHHNTKLFNIYNKISDLQDELDELRLELIEDNIGGIPERDLKKNREYIKRETILKPFYPLMLYCLVSTDLPAGN